MIQKTDWSPKELMERIERGSLMAYEKLVRKEAKEGGYLVLQRNGAIEKVPAIELLKELEAQKKNSTSQL